MAKDLLQPTAHGNTRLSSPNDCNWVVGVAIRIVSIVFANRVPVDLGEERSISPLLGHLGEG